MIRDEKQSLEEIVAERIAADVDGVIREKIVEMLSDVSFEPDEVLGPMTSEEAAKFLGMKYSAFRDLAPNLPRYTITAHRFGYLRRDLLAWLKSRPNGRFNNAF